MYQTLHVSYINKIIKESLVGGGVQGKFKTMRKDLTEVKRL